jgi:hypothetical protein
MQNRCLHCKIWSEQVLEYLSRNLDHHDDFPHSSEIFSDPVMADFSRAQDDSRVARLDMTVHLSGAGHRADERPSDLLPPPVQRTILVVIFGIVVVAPLDRFGAP